MGIKGKIIGKAAKTAGKIIYNHTNVGDAAEDTLKPLSNSVDKVDSKLDELDSKLDNFVEWLDSSVKSIGKKLDDENIKLRNAFISIHPNNHHLWVYEHQVDTGIINTRYHSEYHICDDNRNIVYTAIGNDENKSFKIELFDSKRKKIGKIVRKRLSFHNPVSLKKYYDYYIYIGKNKIGEVNRIYSLGKDIIIITFNKNEIKSERQKKHIYPLIDSNNNLIAEIHDRALFSFLDYRDQSNEVFVILFALAL